mgnify:CR=1 FL=1
MKYLMWFVLATLLYASWKIGYETGYGYGYEACDARSH